ncbi:MAG: hypothetical protein LBC83_02275 [Oscillospiraceae bacterium]|jgi:bacteriorhodopsin|nr:hypothetical protein [Oscillospiraceae bacterium]
MQQVPQALEAAMVVCFGLSWPLSILKSIRARTAKGKSLFFLCAIGLGYVGGIAAKIIAGNITYVFAFYAANLLMVAADICLYFRNRRLDRRAND